MPKVQEEAEQEPEVVFEIPLAHAVRYQRAVVVFDKHTGFTLRTVGSPWRPNYVASLAVLKFDNVH